MCAAMGRPEPHHTERVGDHLRIYAGEESTFLRPGEYTYTFRYRTTRQIRHFADYDEVYWNATGNFWTFPINRAVATVTLPDGATVVQHAAYTGRVGEAGNDFAVTARGDRSMTFETTRVLAPGEGLTVAVAFPKGIVPEAGGLSRFLRALWDNVGILILGFGAVGAGAYYYTTWDRVGRDPQKGIVIPMFVPPSGLSPAAMSYVHYQGFAAAGGSALRAFIAALMSLAVKRRLEIDDDGDTVVLNRTGGARDALPGGEAVIMDSLLFGGSFAFTKANGETIKNVQKNFRSAILREHEGVFFRDNFSYFVIGAGLCVAALAAFAFLSRPTEDEVVVLVATFAAAAGGAFVLSMGARRVLGWLPGGGSVLFGILLTIAGAFILAAGAVALHRLLRHDPAACGARHRGDRAGQRHVLPSPARPHHRRAQGHGRDRGLPALSLGRRGRVDEHAESARNVGRPVREIPALRGCARGRKTVVRRLRGPSAPHHAG
jgi:hypothetical protein